MTKKSVVSPTDSQPESLDWRVIGAVSPVKNQGSCGSCWAFSTVGTLEGLNVIKSGNPLTSFSPQELVDCSNTAKYDNMGCRGGWPHSALDYVMDFGILPETDYPYLGRDMHCSRDDISSKNKYEISGYTNITYQDNNELYAAAGVIPVSVCIDATVLQFYRSGILGKTCGQNLDHAVLVVGYDKSSDGKDYWIVKNSWGSNWGVKGYFYVERVTGVG